MLVLCHHFIHRIGTVTTRQRRIRPLGNVHRAPEVPEPNGGQPAAPRKRERKPGKHHHQLDDSVQSSGHRPRKSLLWHPLRLAGTQPFRTCRICGSHLRRSREAKKEQQAIPRTCQQPFRHLSRQGARNLYV